MLGDLDHILSNQSDLRLKVCTLDAMQDSLPEALIRMPYKSFMTEAHRDEQLPELILLSHHVREPELLGVFGMHVSVPSRVTDLLDFV